jgi:hypothetical protein
MRLAIILVLFIGITLNSRGQYYEKNYGVRFGGTTGFSFKSIKDDTRAFEAILGFRNGGVQVYGLLESYKRIESARTDGLRMYFGPGIHLGFITYRESDCCNSNSSGALRFFPVIGFDGIIGFEYAFPMTPIVIGVDYKPFFELESFYRFKVNLWDLGFTVKYRIQ